MADRRARPRFEIVGNLWGTVATLVALPLRNVSYGGALVDSDVPLTPNSEHHVTVSCEGAHTPTKVRVRHVARAAGGPATYVIGLEFVSVSPALMTHIEGWMSAGSASVEA
jgi:hypothetical protein